MYTIEQIEQAAIGIFAAVTDVSDPPSQARMKVITEIYAGMLASRTQKIDEETLDPNVQQLLKHFVSAPAMS